MHICVISDNQEIKEDTANINRVGAGRFLHVPLTFRTLVISYPLVFHTLAQMDWDRIHIGNTYLIHISNME